ncbi:MAG: ATP-dependent zinc metalloprotease FtsH [Fusobacteriaceae bacterium]|nr:ATP-dependent zinc metalloprotease FtsH [Fusobacteriaceae bacterium]MBP6467516.1 ATP-dependent zinc metalloprotease FtsH [Fusobacteriaceae bacterium]MBP9595899.1 ATP-dependent zinc metalloprotease FtsH [Fusobacteriaceae bacterium]
MNDNKEFKDEEKEDENLEKEKKENSENNKKESKEDKKKEVKKILFIPDDEEENDEEKENENKKKNPKKPGNKVTINFKNIVLLIFLVVLVISLPNLFNAKAQKKYSEITYSQFLKYVENEKILKLEEKEGFIYGTNKETEENLKAKMITDRISADTAIMESVKKYNIDVKALDPEKMPLLLSVLVSWFPMILLIFIWFFMISRMNKGSGGGGGPQIFNMGKSKTKDGVDQKQKTTFADVAGADDAKAELIEIVQFLKEPKKFQEIGAKIPKGVLLKGQPGTGKTLIAKAVAGEAGVPFFSISGSEFVEMFVGVGASRVRDLFSKARKAAPCIVFIDEIDAVGRKRGSGQGGGNDEREQTLNQLLVEMDGFGNEETIIVIAATNRDEILDKALTRPGRFDRQVSVDAPDIKGREAILNVHSKGKKLSDDVDLARIARKIAGFVGADIANMLNEAAILAARAGRKIVTMADIEEASEKVAYGPAKKSKVLSDKEKKLTAYHEGGHALINTLLEHTIPAYKVTIIPRGGAGGYLMQVPTEEKSYKMKNEFLADIRVAFGGRVAEEIILGDVSTGASSDIAQATSIANYMVTRVGMSKAGLVQYDATQQGDYYKNQTFYSQDTGKELDNEIRRILDEAYEDTKRLIIENVDKLHDIANALLEKETITGEELNEIVFGKAETTEPEEKGEEHKIDIIINDESTDLITEEKEEVIEKTAE